MPDNTLYFIDIIKSVTETWQIHCLSVFTQVFATDFSYHGNTLYYSLGLS